ncbi:hypothetical protein RB620_05685 [Paenibacillus sp. LHD-117]|uniref:TolB family protein n=1 Tax=Paenibacillus sp. LHD-117 TaxID=3071412 RepID=UPI0027E0EF16|nr:hypothetical protein [Paenibacillus sp. LHD-117]MDQ6418928.1 hypothetical protein [Paenibacillus sp. LHD-117]
MWIAYTSDRGGHFDIWLYRPVDAAHFPVTQGIGESFSVPYWSPDVRKIAFIGKQNIVYVLDLSMGTMARIDQIEPFTLLDWSPDSQWLAYVKDGRIVVYHTVAHSSRTIIQPGASDVQWFPSGLELLFAAPDAAGISQLYRMNSDGTAKRPLTRNTEGPLNNARLSPDGAFALYTSPGVSISIITTVDLSTGQTYPLEGGPLAKNYFPEWAPNAAGIAYSATAFDDDRGYYSLIQTDGKTGGKQLTRAISDCFATPVSWSPDGHRIAYLSGCENEQPSSQIWIQHLRHPYPVKIIEGGRITALQWSSPVRMEHPLKMYSNALYRIRFLYPAHWQQVSEERYEGADGFFQISAISSENRLEEVCRAEAFHPLRPYGSAPRIVMTTIQGQTACFIFPSADQPAEMRKQSALIVKYPYPIQIGETSYNYFILWADHDHIRQLARRLTFI